MRAIDLHDRGGWWHDDRPTVLATILLLSSKEWFLLGNLARGVRGFLDVMIEGTRNEPTDDDGDTEYFGSTSRVATRDSRLPEWKR
jgi:hypothetical protein